MVKGFSAHMGALIPRLASRGGPWAHAREPAVILGAYFIYMVTRRLLGHGLEDDAFANAARLIAFETEAGFFWEAGWHQWAQDAGHWFIVLFNWVYILTFFPIVLTAALVYYIKDRERYFYYRNVILLSFVFALAMFAAYPMAPPRIMAEYGFVDSFMVYGPAFYAGQEMASYYNAYAAMPSLHFAWTVIFGVLFFRQGGWLLRAAGVLYPALTLFAIVVTANHYIMDAVVGGAMMAATYAVYEVVFRRRLLNRAHWDRVKAALAPAPSFHDPNRGRRWSFPYEWPSPR